MRRLRRLLTILVLFVITVGGLFYFFQERVIFFPERLSADFRFEFPVPFREGNLEVPTQKFVNYLVFNPESARGAILYFHGNAGSLRNWGWAGAQIAKKTGWCVWIVDYPGFGKSSGPLPKSERLLLEAARAVRNEMKKVGSKRPLILYGRSIGSGIASALNLEEPAHALILETPYRSLAKLGREIYPFLPEAISRFDLDNERALKLSQGKGVLIVHGTADRVIPFRHARILAEQLPHARFVPVEGGDHNDLSEFPDYWEGLSSFLATIK